MDGKKQDLPSENLHISIKNHNTRRKQKLKKEQKSLLVWIRFTLKSWKAMFYCPLLWPDLRSLKPFTPPPASSCTSWSHLEASSVPQVSTLLCKLQAAHCLHLSRTVPPCSVTTSRFSDWMLKFPPPKKCMKYLLNWFIFCWLIHILTDFRFV